MIEISKRGLPLWGPCEMTIYSKRGRLLAISQEFRFDDGGRLQLYDPLEQVRCRVLENGTAYKFFVRSTAYDGRWFSGSVRYSYGDLNIVSTRLYPGSDVVISFFRVQYLP